MSPLAPVLAPVRQLHLERVPWGLVIALISGSLGFVACQESPRQILEKGHVRMEAKQFQDAVRYYELLADLYPQSAEAEEAFWLTASLYQHEMRSPEKAIESYQALLRHFPEGVYRVQALFALAEIYIADPEQRQDAVRIYQRLLRLKNSPSAESNLLLRLAQLYLQLGRVEYARATLLRLMETHPEAPQIAEAYYLVAYSYFLQRRSALARTLFQRMAEKFPEHPLGIQAQFFRADLLEEVGALKEALQTFLAIHKQHPNPSMVETRIVRLRARLKSGVR